MRRLLCLCAMLWGASALAQEPPSEFAPLPAQQPPAAVPAPPPPPQPPPAATLPPPLPLPPPPVQEAPVEDAGRSGFSVRLSLGGTYRNLYGIHFGGGDAAILLGGQKNHVGFFADLEGFLGMTASGLLTSNFQVGFIVEGEIGRLRIGGGVLLGWLFIRRITTDGYLFDFTVGPALHGSYDLIRWDGHGFYVFARAAADWLLFATNTLNTGTPLMPRVSAGLGIRY